MEFAVHSLLGLNPFLRDRNFIIRFTTVFTVVLLAGYTVTVSAQSNRRMLFREDNPNEVLARDNQKKKLLGQQLKNAAQDLKVDGGAVQYDNENNRLLISGGVVSSSGEYQIQANQGSVDVQKREGDFRGDMLLAHPEFSVNCSSSYVNVPYEVGVFNDAKIRIDAAELIASADTMIKSSEKEFTFYDTAFTTCDSPLKNPPWQITADTLDITVDGYGHAYWAGFKFYGVPLLYAPYIGFPVLTQRTSGFLAPDFGVNNRDGFTATVPYFIAFDDSTDATVTPFIATDTRVGAKLDFRKEFSRQHSLRSRFLFSDEGARGDDLRGLVTAVEPVEGDESLPFEKERFGGFYNQRWTTDPDSDLRMSAIADIHYVNDDFILRELPDNDIGLRNATFTSSRVVFRSGLGAYGSAELFSEYNQLINGNIDGTDETVLQRLPELNVTFGRDFRPFGFNPYGLKLSTNLRVNATEFYREEGIDGTRINIQPELSVPFHYQNYISGAVGVSLYDTRYNINVPGSSVAGAITADDFEDSRQTLLASGVLSTAVEKVFEVEEDGVLGSLMSLGSEAFQRNLQRVKHVIEPEVRFLYAPNVDQESLPFFDSIDRIRHRSLATYGFRTELIGRYDPEGAFGTDIEELTPLAEELPQLGFVDSIMNLNRPLEMARSFRRGVPSRVGGQWSIFSASLFQTYDYVEDEKNIDPIRTAFSDVSGNFFFNPNPFLSMGFEGNYNPNRATLSSWRTSLGFRDDRGDYLNLAYSKVNPLVLVSEQVGDDIVTSVAPGTDIENIQAQLELAITDRIKIGYFGRYDAEEGEFIEQMAGLRFVNECDCWRLDLDVTDRINPDRQQVNVRFTLSGIGEITQGILSNVANQRDTNP